MVLVDTSVWIDHFNRSDSSLQLLLNDYEVVTHPYILGELVCGNFRNRKKILALLSDLPSIMTISMEEYFIFVEKNKLHGLGLGFVDTHLLASSLIAQCLIYSKDKTLVATARLFGIAHTSHC